jgi:Mn2+/Fe2+ NRAMP family transporter
VVSGEFSFVRLAEALVEEGGKHGKIFLAIGLFAAGFTSSVTAPLASAITLKSLFGKENQHWGEKGLYYRLSWLVVLATGLAFALAGFKPVPAIITAQALNGFILPFASFFLVWILNRSHDGRSSNSLINNSLLSITLIISLLIGLRNLLQVFQLEKKILDDPAFSLGLLVFCLFITLLFMYRITRRK